MADKKQKVEDTCFNCNHYSYDVQKTSLPVMRNKVFYKITMKCHNNNSHVILNEKYENVSPAEKQLIKNAPKKCENYQEGSN